MRFFLINEDGGKAIDIPNTNKAINEALGWDDAWNTPTIYINECPYIIICADLGKLRKEPISAIRLINFVNLDLPLQEPFLVGNLLVTKFNGVDDFEDLTDIDIARLEQRMRLEGNYLNAFSKVLIID